MYCQYCGTQNEDGSAFCKACGKPLGKINAVNERNIALLALNITGVVSGALIIMSSFLPFISISFLGVSRSFNLMEGDGIYIIIVAIFGIIASLQKKKEIVVFIGGLSLAMFYIYYLALSKNAGSDNEWEQLAKSLLQKDVGYYFLLIGALGLIISGVVGVVLSGATKIHIWKILSGTLCGMMFIIIGYTLAKADFSTEMSDELAELVIRCGGIIAGLLLLGGVLSVVPIKGFATGSSLIQCLLFAAAALIGFEYYKYFNDMVIWAIWSAVCAVAAEVLACLPDKTTINNL